MAGGSEAQNEEAQALAAQTIGCKPLNRSALHMQACISHPLYISAAHLVPPRLAVRKADAPPGRYVCCIEIFMS